MLSEPGFEEAANAIYNAGPKTLNYREAAERKAARDKAARLEPQRKVFENAYYAYEAHGGTAPFNFEGWMKMSEAERQGIIKHFDLNNVDYKERQLGRLFGRA
jgi:hypothetical protein